jgi:hypothetical protein
LAGNSERPIFVFTKHKYMTNTTTIPVVKLTTGTLAGDVFYGSFNTTVKNKVISVMVSNHIKDVNQEYEFRIANKCQAGFINIHDSKGTASDMMRGWSKNSLVNIQVKHTWENGTVVWQNVFTTKGGKWYSIDRGFLEVMTVGTMRQSFPDMCDMSLWALVNTKTWADKAFVQN